jgi:hypothetical protein
MRAAVAVDVNGAVVADREQLIFAQLKSPALVIGDVL